MKRKVTILFLTFSIIIINDIGYPQKDCLTESKHKIIFDTKTQDDNYEIYTINIDRTGLKKISNGSVRDRQPVYSPDGTRIAFLSERSGNEDIYVMDAGGSNVKQLTKHIGIDADPCWSPDGKEIIFVSERDSCFSLYTMNSRDGSNLKRITFYSAWDGHPAWSNDGKKLQFQY